MAWFYVLGLVGGSGGHEQEVGHRVVRLLRVQLEAYVGRMEDLE